MLRTASPGEAEAGKVHTSKPTRGLGELLGIARILRVSFRQWHPVRL